MIRDEEYPSIAAGIDDVNAWKQFEKIMEREHKEMKRIFKEKFPSFDHTKETFEFDEIVHNTIDTKWLRKFILQSSLRKQDKYYLIRELLL